MSGAVLIAVGDELLAGAHPDLNAPVLARALGGRGVATLEVRVVGDDVAAIAAAVAAGVERAPLVFLTGGLGPTLDDVTRDGIAQAAGVDVVEDPDAIADLVDWYASRGLEMPPSNRRQACFPRGAHVVRNGAGTAPGFRLRIGASWVVSLPGPPRELAFVLEHEVLPWLVADGLVGEALLERKLFLFGVPEGAFAERSGDWMDRGADPLISCSAKSGSLWITLRGRDADRAVARARLDARAADLRREFGAAIYSERDPRLELALGEVLLSTGTSFTVAESCTGGLVAGLLTEMPGISAVFGRGFVTYSNAAKQRDLGVPAALLEEHGAVSEPVAAAMARGAAEAAGARLAVAITGIAGPDGGSPEKPVGQVWFATSLDGSVETFRRDFPALGREWVRAVAARTALYRAWLRIGGPDGPPTGLPGTPTGCDPAD